MSEVARVLSRAIALTILFALAMAGCAATHPASENQPKATVFSKQEGPLRIGIVRMVHGHVEGLLYRASVDPGVKVVGFYEPNRELFDRLAAKYHLDPALRFDSLEAMLDATHPEAVSVMSSIRDHRAAVDACAPRGVHLLLEKPLAYSAEEAHHIQDMAARYGVLALTNFETSWYASVREARRLVESGSYGSLRRLVFRDGHRGPREIGCSEEFLSWLTDPEENGGGALVDFGCYGAVQATWFMHGERPLRVLATASTLKKGVYPRVDDDATILLVYPTCTAVLQASWNWTHDCKEMDVFADRGSIHTGKWNDLRLRAPDQKVIRTEPPAKPNELENEWNYLRSVIRGSCSVDPLSSIEYNAIVAEILDEARRQVKASRGRAN